MQREREKRAKIKNNRFYSGLKWHERPEQTIKPSSVLHVGAATICLGHRLPDVSIDLTRGVGGQLHPPPIWSFSGWGLPSRPVSRPLVCSYHTVSPLSSTQPQFALLPNDPGQTCRVRMIKIVHPRIECWTVFFCGTFLRVAPTGRYPAPCPAELGLSSKAISRNGPRGCLVYSGTDMPRFLFQYNMERGRLSKINRCPIVSRHCRFF